jgi:hypothetical protein
VIHTVNQAQILDDSLALARASLLPYELALNLTLYLRTEKEYLPWQAFFANLKHLSDMLLKKESYELLKVEQIMIN